MFDPEPVRMRGWDNIADDSSFQCEDHYSKNFQGVYVDAVQNAVISAPTVGGELLSPEKISTKY